MKTKEVRAKYNQDVIEKFGNDYEYNRWFKNEILKAGYGMTKKSIEAHALKKRLDFESYLELGPGPGTWTKLFLKEKKEADYYLVDISKSMLNLARKSLTDYERINFVESDFLEFNPNKQYDFFFSSRAIEYIPDKDKTINKIMSLLKSQGRGFLITKTPKYLRRKVLQKKTTEFHQGQIEPKEFKRLLEKYGAKEIQIFPVTMSFPVLRITGLNKLLYRIFYKLPLNPISKFFAESYCVKFAKK